MTKERGCELWQNARVLAQDRGFDLSKSCPMEDVCSGTTCIFIEPISSLNEENKKTSQHPDQVQPARL